MNLACSFCLYNVNPKWWGGFFPTALHRVVVKPPAWLESTLNKPCFCILNLSGFWWWSLWGSLLGHNTFSCDVQPLEYVYYSNMPTKTNNKETFDFRINHKYVNSPIYGPQIYHLSLIYLSGCHQSIIYLSNNDLSVLC